MTVSDNESAADSSIPPPSTDSGPNRPTAGAKGKGEGINSAQDQASSPALPAEEWQLRVELSHWGRCQHQLIALIPQTDKHPQGADQLHLKWPTNGGYH